VSVLLGEAHLEPAKTFSLTDLVNAAGPGHGATQRYVRVRLDADVLVADSSKQRRYQANTAHPFFAELSSICRKTRVDTTEV
jgi:hypothetical protein